MKAKTIISTICLVALLGASALAQQQQDTLDQGAADSLFVVVSQPEVGGNDSTGTIELYAFNDVQTLTSLAVGFEWDNPNLQMDSGYFTPEGLAAFDFLQFLWYGNNISQTNTQQKFQFSGLRMSGSLAPSATPTHIATYHYHLNDWTINDSICIDTTVFSGGTIMKFVDLDGTNYVPIFRGKECVFDPNRPEPRLLSVTPATLDYSAVEGGSNPDQQYFSVSELGGSGIAYSASTLASWIVLGNASGTTPDSVTVDINITGLAAAPYYDSVMVESEEATNSPVWVYVSLTIEPGNQAPVLDPIGDQSGNEGELIEFGVTASDPDETVPSLSADPLPDGAVFVDHDDGTGTFSWTPTYDQAGVYPIIFTASDGELTDEETVTVTVYDVNRPPVLDSIGPVTVYEEELLSFVVTASDPDGGYPGLSAVPLPDGAAFDDNGDGTGYFYWTPTNTQAGSYDVTFTASDGDLTDDELVNITVLDADGFVIDPNPLDFTAVLGGANPDDQTFEVMVSDSSAVPFLASESSSWISLDSASGTTPANVIVHVDITGLPVGTHTDSIEVADQTPENPLDPAWVYVNLLITEPIMLLAVEPDTLAFEISEGNLLPVEQTFDVDEQGGGGIGYEATTESSWMTLTGETGTTPGTVTVSVDPGTAALGTHFDSIMVSSEEADNSPVWVYVQLTVTPCPVLQPALIEFNTTAFAGDPVSITDTVMVTSSGPDEIPWSALIAPDNFDFDPVQGITPDSVEITYERTFTTAGEYADTSYINAVGVPEEWDCPSQIMIIANVTVNRPPSADTVIVVSQPAVPGMQVTMPILFSNSCELSELGIVLYWTSADIHLDSVSFAGSALEYVNNKTVSIDLDMFEVQVSADVAGQSRVPIGSEQLWANLHFSLTCEIETGTYGLGLGWPWFAGDNIYFVRDCGEGDEKEIPEYLPGSILVGSSGSDVCGYVVDPGDNEIEGATVELWSNFPSDGPNMSTSSNSWGSFAFEDVTFFSFSLYAYKEGYYPGTVENVQPGEKIKIVLEPLQELIPTSQWVDYFCPDSSNTFMGAQLPVGAVVEAFTQDGLLVGQKMTTHAGIYGFMPVYRGDSQALPPEPGAVEGDTISFHVNQMIAVATGDVIYPPASIHDTMHVCLEVLGAIEKECDLFEGWNLVSWNVDTDTDDILEVLNPIMDYVDVVLGFEQGGLTFDPDLQQFSTLWNVDHLSGYWIRIKDISQVTLTVTGPQVPAITPIPITTGWNLVSYLPEAGLPPMDALASVHDNLTIAYGFDQTAGIQIYQPGGGAFNVLELMEPCNGYWLKTASDDQLVYASVTAAPLATPVDPTKHAAPFAALGQSTPAVSGTNWTNLYSGELRLNGRTVKAAAVIAAYSVEGNNPVGRYVTNQDGRFGFMPVYADGAGEQIIGMKPGDRFYLTINDVPTDEVFEWTGNGDRIEVSALSAGNSVEDDLPTGYSLDQNYPNPFNPTTTICFSMPAAGRARIDIFNILGRSIATPFDGEVQAGITEVVWNSRNTGGEAVASGIYFYRLTADNYSETRKMMLLK